VLIARLDNAGDVLLAGPAVRAVALAGCEVVMLCGPNGRAAAELLPGVSRVEVVDAPWSGYQAPAVDRQSLMCFVDRIASMRIDEAVILTSFHQSPLPLALLLRMAKVPLIAAVSTDYPGTLLDRRLEDPGDVHEVERALATVGALGYRLPTGDDGRMSMRVGASPPGLDQPYVVIHSGASVPARGLPRGLGRELAELLVTGGRTVVLTGERSDRSSVIAATDGERFGVIDLFAATDFSQLAAVIAGADVLVCGNTGPAHIAAAVGTPVVSVFAPVVPAARWRPWQVPHVLLGQQDIGCAGCRSRECPLPEQQCIAGITATAVLDAILQLVESVAAA